MSETPETDLGIETLKGSLAKGFMAVIGFAGTVLFANLLGRFNFGAFYLLLAVVQVVERPVSGGIAEAGQKRASETGADIPRIIGTVSSLAGVWVAVSVIGAYLLRDELAGYLQIDYAFESFALLLFALAFFHVGIVFIHSQGRVGRATWFDALRSVFTVGFQAVLVLAGFQVLGMTIGFAGATILTANLVILAVGSKVLIPTRATIQSTLRYAKYSIPTSLVWKTFNRFDLLLLGFLVSPGAVGDYEVALKLTIPAIFVAEIFGTGIMVRGSRLDTAGKRDEFSRDLYNGLSFASILAIPLLFGSIAVGRPLIVTLYGQEYAAAAPLLIGLCLFQVLKTQSLPLFKSLNGLDRPDLGMWLASAALLVNIVLGVVLTLEFGPIGVVVATVIAEGVRLGLVRRFIRSEIPEVTLTPRPFFAQVIAGALMLLGVLAVRSWLELPTVFEVAILVSLGGVLYFGFLTGLSGQFRLTVWSILDRAGYAQYLPGWIDWSEE